MCKKSLASSQAPSQVSSASKKSCAVNAEDAGVFFMKDLSAAVCCYCDLIVDIKQLKRKGETLTR